MSGEAAALATNRGAHRIEGVDADAFFTSLGSKVAALTEVDRAHPVSVATAVAELKHLLVDPAHRIRFRDLICEEARRLRSASDDPSFPLNLNSNKDRMRARVATYEGHADILEVLFGVGCAWGADPQPFVEALEIAAAASPMTASGSDLRGYPALRCLYAGGIAAVYQQNWNMLRALTQDATPNTGDGRLPMANALNYWSVFDRRETKWLPGLERYYTPVSAHLFNTLREPLRDTIVLGQRYEATFDRFEYLLGLIIEDSRTQQPSNVYTDPAPVGYFTRNRYPTSGAPLWERMKTEAEQAGADWGPIRAGLFGGSIERFAVAETNYREEVLQNVRCQH